MPQISHVVLGFTMLMALTAQQAPPRAPVIQSVDLLVPFPPVPFNQSSGPQLAYELHITNFLSVDVSLNAVQVRTADGPMLAEYRDSDLQRRIVRPGFRNDHATPQIVGPGARAVVNFWIALPVGSPPPASVNHLIELDVVRASGSVRTAVEGGDSLVSSQPVATLESAATRRSLGSHLRPAAQGRASNGVLHSRWACTNSRTVCDRFHHASTCRRPRAQSRYSA